MKNSDSALERMRVMIGLTLILVCGSILWRDHIKPVVNSGKINVLEARGEIREKYLEWLHESEVKDRIRRKQEEEAKQAAEKGTENKGASDLKAPIPAEDVPRS